jgi:anaerobic magnesium-protoporphyrin IX monomethyl ester cyclase
LLRGIDGHVFHSLSMMKILLIYPYFLDARVLTTEDVGALPLGIYYVASVLKANNYDVEILNWHDINTNPGKIHAILAQKKPDVIGFSILHGNRWGAIDIARFAKQMDSRITVVFGGVGATFLWEHLLTHFGEIDYIVRGEGEHTFLNLVRHLESGHPEAIESLDGLAFRKNGRAVRTPDAPLLASLDDLPDPARYFAYPHLSLTRGCAGNCNFCGSPRFWGRHVRFHSAEYFVEQIRRLCQKGIRFFYFSDDTFTASEKRVIQVCKKIIAAGLDITWNAISRVDYVNEEILFWMRKAGCIQISYGVESGSEKIRDFLEKKITINSIQKAFTLTRRYGIMARAYFIYGCPQESWQTIEETINLIDRIKPLSTVFYILDIFPGTRLYEDFKQRLQYTDDIWLKRIEDILYFETDPDLSRDQILAFGKKLRAHFYKSLPRYVDTLALIDNPELYPQHSAFYSRLAMTFDYGDYAHIEEIENKGRIAADLYQRALSYYPNANAYLGLGILFQKRGANRESTEILSQGLSHFPEDARINICMGASLMNLGHWEQALSRLLKFQDNKDAVRFAILCYQSLGDDKKAAAMSRLFDRME